MTANGTKRAAKVRKRHERKEADMSRIDAREARLRLALDKHGGETGEIMTTLVRYFTTYATTPRPDLMLDALDWIQTLNLMALPEHRYGIAGAIRGAMDLVPILPQPEGEETALTTPDDVPAGPPPEPLDIQAWRRGFPKILESVDRLVPPPHDVAINRTGHIDYMGMRWLVARNPLFIDRILRLTHRDDDVGEAAIIFLDTYNTMSEVQDARMRAAGIRVPTVAEHKAAQAATAEGMARAMQVDELVRYLTVTPSEREHMVYVGWVPAGITPSDRMPVFASGAFVIATTDGQPPKHTPERWHDQSVSVRKATTQELTAHQELAMERDRP